MDAPKQYKIRTVKIYWTCQIPEHRHKSKELAQRCLEKEAAKRVTNKWTPKALQAVLELRERGATYKEIGQKYGIQREPVRQLVNRAIRQRAKRLEQAAEECRKRFAAPPHEEIESAAREMAEATAKDWRTDPALGACIARYYLDDLAI